MKGDVNEIMFEVLSLSLLPASSPTVWASVPHIRTIGFQRLSLPELWWVQAGAGEAKPLLKTSGSDWG